MIKPSACPNNRDRFNAALWASHLERPGLAQSYSSVVYVNFGARHSDGPYPSEGPNVCPS
jgi:hypothetical protein